jgi:hypothetical protein
MTNPIQRHVRIVNKPRWKCPICDSTTVQVSYPTWYRESSDYEREFVETDDEAQPLWWYCELCDESGSGRPEENT